MEVLYIMDSFISWIGGKKLLRKEIHNRFPKERLKKYVEVFGGAAWVLFYKEKHAEMEIYNDINSNLVNLFKCVKYHPSAIKDELENILNSREFYNNFKELYKSSALTDIQRAAKYLYMIKASYGAKVTSFGAKSRDIADTKYLLAIKERLKRVIIENKSFEELIKQYDRSDTLFYCDPPYFGTEKYYDLEKTIFDERTHIKLYETLRTIKGKFILSYNDNDYVKNLYQSFKIEKVNRQNNLTLKVGSDPYQELIIRNY